MVVCDAGCQGPLKCCIRKATHGVAQLLNQLRARSCDVLPVQHGHGLRWLPGMWPSDAHLLAVACTSLACETASGGLLQNQWLMPIKMIEHLQAHVILYGMAS